MTKLSEALSGSEQKNEMRESPSLCSGSGHQNHQMSNSDSKMVYQCPMKCEGEKTYPAPGNCPVCNMHLSAVNEVHQL
jgi:hypothetical protein